MTSRPRKALSSKLGWFYKGLSIILTFHFLVFTSVLLKSSSLEFFIQYYNQLFSTFDLQLWNKWLQIYHYPFSVMLIGIFLQFLPLGLYSKLYSFFERWPIFLTPLVLALMIIILYQFSYLEAIPFLYIVY